MGDTQPIARMPCWCPGPRMTGRTCSSAGIPSARPCQPVRAGRSTRLQFRRRHREGAPGAVEPGQPFLLHEHACVGQSRPRHKRCRITPLPRVISLTSSSGKISSLRFSPTHASISPATGTQMRASSGSVDVEHLLALAGRGDHFGFRHDEAVPGGRGDEQFALGIVDEDRRGSRGSLRDRPSGAPARHGRARRAAGSPPG